MQGVVVMRFRRVMDHDVAVSNQPIDQGRICNIALHEGEAVFWQTRNRREVARIGQLVQDGDVAVRVFKNIVDKI